LVVLTILSSLALVNAEFGSAITTEQLSSLRGLFPSFDYSLVKPADDVSKPMAEAVQELSQENDVFVANWLSQNVGVEDKKGECMHNRDMLYFNYYVNDQCGDEDAAWGIGSYPMDFCYTFPTRDGFNSLKFTKGTLNEEFSLNFWLFRDSKCNLKDPSNYFYMPDIFKSKLDTCYGNHWKVQFVNYMDIITPEEPAVGTSFYFDGPACKSNKTIDWWRTAPILMWEEACHCTKVDHTPKLFSTHTCTPGMSHSYSFFDGKSCLQEPIDGYGFSLDHCTYNSAGALSGMFDWIDYFFVDQPVFTTQTCVEGLEHGE